jgi:RNA polymerase sigma-70 factor (ECF subfamily)
MRHDSEPSDRALLESAAAGNADAFASFYRRHLAVVVAFLRQRTPNAEVAADLAAETFVSALDSLRRTGVVPEVPLGWLMTIARNKLVDSIRRGRVESDTRRRLALEPLTFTDADLADVERMAADTDVVEALTRRLPPDQLAAFTARIFDEREYGEIAAELSVSEAVVRKRVSRAMRTLRKGLGRS